MSKLYIFVGPTRILLPATKTGYTTNGIYLVPFIKQNLCETEWDPRIHRSITMYNYTYYHADIQMAAFPRYCLDILLTFLEDNGTVATLRNLDIITPSRIAIPLKKGIVPRNHQIEVLDFLTSGNNYLPISVFTGGGKTVITIIALSKLRHPTLIILGSLIEQWNNVIRQFTTLTDDQICIVQGRNACAKLAYKVTKRKYRPKIVIMSLQTYLNYAKCKNNYVGMPPLQDIIRQMGIGVCVKDEIHQNFHANVTTDLFTDIKYNIYLSATYQRTSPQGRRIFNMVFPSELVFGGHLSKRHCHVQIVGYRVGIPYAHVGKFITYKGYNHSKYEKFLINKPIYGNEYIRRCIHPLIRMYYLSRKIAGQKLLILCATQDFAFFLHNSIVPICSNESISIFFSGNLDSKFGNEENLESDIIITTIKSGGTGRDISNLITVINTVSFKSPTLTEQVMGRLREIKGVDTIYVDMYNIEIPSQVDHARQRKEIYNRKAATVTCSEL